MRKTIKKLLLSLAMLVMAAAVCCGAGVEAQAAQVLQSGACGEALTWTLDDAGTLTISGNGAMYDWSSAYEAQEVPWSAYKDQIFHVVIEEGVTSIGASAFYLCEQMQSIQIAETVAVIGRDSFYHCSALLSVTIPDAVTKLGVSIFWECTSLKEVDLGNGVQSLGMYTFKKCKNLEIVRIGSGLKKLDSVSFDDCVNVKQVHITDLRAWAEVECGGYRGTPMQGGPQLYLNGELVEKLEIPEGTTHIGAFAFLRCQSITEVVIPDSVTSIGESAFNQASQLRKVTVGSGLTTSGEHIFRNCPSLTDVTFSDDCAAHLDRYAFADCSALVNVYTGGVTRFEDSAFWNCTSLETITFGPGLQRLDSDIFENCTALREIIFTGDVVNSRNATYTSLTNVVAYYPERWGGYFAGGITWVAYSDHIHTWDEGVVTEEGTCNKFGSYTYTCTQCEATYSEKLPKEPDKHNIYEDWITHNDWHCHRCQDCGEVWDFGEHVPGPAATETEPQRCTVCQRILRPATGHVHQADQWSTDPLQHWKECSCGQTLELAEHRYSTYCDNTCNVCGYVSDADHIWSSSGYCLYCGKENPDYVPPTQPPVTEPTEPSEPETTAPTQPAPTEPKPTETQKPVQTQPSAPVATEPTQSGDAGETESSGVMWIAVIITIVIVIASAIFIVLWLKKTA